MNYRQFLSIASLALSWAASDFVFSQTPSNGADKPLEEPARSQSLTVGDGLSRSNRLPGYYVVFEKKESGWAVGDISTAAREIPDFSEREILYFSKDLSYVDPEFSDVAVDPKSGRFRCMTGVLRTKGDNHTSRYNPCQSSLTKTIDAKLGANATLAVASLGISLLTGTTVREMAVDKAGVLALVQQTDVLERLQKMNAAEELLAYQQAFNKAKSITALSAFITRYSNNDPEGLVAQAIERREIAVAKDYRGGLANASTSTTLDAYIQRYQGNDPYNLIPKAIERRDQLRIEERKVAENERLRRAADEEQRRKLEMESRNRMLAILKTPGTKICNGYDGLLERNLGAVTMYGPVTKKISGRYTVLAVTEGAAGSRLQFRVSTIYHTSTSGDTTTMNALTVGSNTFQPGAVAWDDIANWSVCN